MYFLRARDAIRVAFSARGGRNISIFIQIVTSNDCTFWWRLHHFNVLRGEGAILVFCSRVVSVFHAAQMQRSCCAATK